MKKLELMNKVLTSTLKADDKALLSELLLRADDQLECFPSVERLCQVRGIKYEKNFKGVEHYLPGLVTKQKRGRKNYYTLNGEAIAALPQFGVTIKHTPALEGVDTPAVPDDTPVVAENTPALEGANNTKNNTKDSSIESTRAPVVPPSAEHSPILNDKEEAQEPAPIDLNWPDAVVPIDSTTSDTPATEGLPTEDKARARAEAAVRATQNDPSSTGEPLSEEEISKAVDLVLDLSFKRTVRGTQERAERAVWELQPLEW